MNENKTPDPVATSVTKGILTAVLFLFSGCVILEIALRVVN